MRDCVHGRQIGKCADCDVVELEEEVARLTALLAQARSTYRREGLEKALQIAKDTVTSASVYPTAAQAGSATGVKNYFIRKIKEALEAK